MKFFKHVKGLTVAALALALLCIAFASTTKANAKQIVEGVTATYNPETDQVEINAPDGTVVKVYSLKTADATLTDKATPVVFETVSGAAVTVALNDKTKGKGIKVAENKPVYLYISAVSGAAIEGKTANFKLAAAEVTKISSITFDYSKAYVGNNEPVLVVKYLTAEITDKTKALTADAAKIKVSDVVDKKVASDYTGSELTGGELYKLITQVGSNNKAVKHKFNVQILGSPDASGDFDGVRNAKVKSVSPKAPAKAPKAKVDYVKGTIALKAGFDYVVLTAEPASGAAAIPAGEWYTILPADKENGSSTKIAKKSTEYTYSKKLTADSSADEKASFYQGDKIKSVDLADICAEAWDNEATSGVAIIYVRKTATDKAPASLVSDKITVKKAAAAPTFAASGAAISTYDAKKKVLKVATITGANDGSKTGSQYEILVVKTADLKDIDWAKVKWTKFNPAKGLKAKLSSKISYTTGKEAAPVCTVDDNGKAVEGVVILVRGTGVKASKTAAGALPTEVVTIKLVSDGEGDKLTYELQLVAE